MPTTLEKLRMEAPETANIPDATCLYQLECAPQTEALSFWGDTYWERACILRAAHNLVRSASGGGGQAGPIISQRVGDWQVSHGWITQREDGLNATVYGQMLINLRNARGKAGPMWTPNTPGIS